jgi:NAD-dependent deacetylase
MEELYKKVALLILSCNDVVALTGAGMSAESGIQTFRDKNGLWDTYDPMVYASIEAFRSDPAKYWTIRGDFIRNYDDFQPNPGHRALAELEKMGYLRSVITQNIDGLHTKAGNKKVIEIHGSLRETYCLTCGKEYTAPRVPDGLPPYCACGGVLKPNTVLFGEALSPDVLTEASNEARDCKLMLVIGTSSLVQPAASLPHIAREGGSKIIEINIEKAFPLADYFIQEKAGIALPSVVEALKARVSQ